MRFRSLIAVSALIIPVMVACGALDQQKAEEILSGVVQTAAAGVTFVAATPGVNIGVPPTTLVASATSAGTDYIPTHTPEGGLSGSIAGHVSYPSEFIPAQAVVAFRVGGQPNEYYYVVTQEGQSAYELHGLPPGTYQIVAYAMLSGSTLSAGYSQAVPCGLGANCADHSLIAVLVNGGQVTSGIDPSDWYAPPGTFPPNPLP